MPAPKTPLQHALDTLVALEEQQKMLRLLHAVVMTTWSTSTIQSSDKPDSEIAADSRCYARSLREIESLLGEKPNPFVTPKSGHQIPLPPAEFDRIKASRTIPPTP